MTVGHVFLQLRVENEEVFGIAAPIAFLALLREIRGRRGSAQLAAT
jgi:hypothetical protein